MSEKGIIAFLRISRPDYNRDLYETGKLYMNKQTRFLAEEGLTEGQKDKSEGLIYKENDSFRLFLSWKSGLRDEWATIPGSIISASMHPNAYIFCLYAIHADEVEYDAEQGVFSYTIPWAYLKTFFKKDSENEVIIISTPERFLNAFISAAKRDGKQYAYAEVEYDLEEKVCDPKYFMQVNETPLEAVFHKSKIHKLEKEYRIAVTDNYEKNHVELYLEGLENIFFYKFPVKEEKSIQVGFLNLHKEDDGRIKYSPKICLRYKI